MNYCTNILRTSLVLVLMLLASGSLAAETPEKFKDLETHLEDETAFVDAVRAYDRVLTTRSELAQMEAEMRKKQGDQEGFEKSMANARAATAEIRVLYDWAMGHFPNNARLQNYYGELLYDAYGDAAGALKAWTNATSMDPKLAEPHSNLAMHYCHSGRYELGFSEMETALKLDKNNPDFNYNMCQLMMIHNIQYEEIKGISQSRIYKKAMKHSATAVKYLPTDYDVLEDYALNFFAAERFGVEADWEDAAVAWQAAREHAHNDTQRFFTWLNEGRALLRTKHPDRGIVPLENALKIMPDSGPAQELLRRAREQVGVTAESEPTVEPEKSDQ